MGLSDSNQQPPKLKFSAMPYNIIHDFLKEIRNVEGKKVLDKVYSLHIFIKKSIVTYSNSYQW